MSTKASVFWNYSESHVFEETAQSRYDGETFLGCDLYADLHKQDLGGYTFAGESLTIRFKNRSSLVECSKLIAWVIPVEDLIYIEFDDAWLSIGIKGGSAFAKMLTALRN